MKLFGIITFIIFILTACNKQESVSEIIIDGFVKNLPEGKVYLTHSHDFTEILDSAQVKNGYFKFKIKLDSAFVPFSASIHYPDSSEYYQIKQLFYLNSYQSKGKIKSATNAFFIGKENIKINGNLDTLPILRVVAGKENELYQKFMNKGFGFIENSNSTKRLARIESFKRVVKQNPYSYYLLKEIYYNKEAYAEKELIGLLSLFNKNVQNSKSGEEFRSYLANRPDPNTPYANLLLTNFKNEKHKIFNANAQVNLLVFWASWCGPCREEIPALKEVYNTFKSKGLNLASISIDEEHENWRKALSKENMDWQQFIVEKEEIGLVKQQFNFSAVPHVVLTDNKGKEILKITGYYRDNVIKISTAIKKYLASR